MITAQGKLGRTLIRYRLLCPLVSQNQCSSLVTYLKKSWSILEYTYIAMSEHTRSGIRCLAYRIKCTFVYELKHIIVSPLYKYILSG